MLNRWIALLVLAFVLGGCAHAPAADHSEGRVAAWNDGIWNSVLGYHGPANATVDGGP